MRTLTYSALIAVALGSPLVAQVATFDAFAEGTNGTTLVDGAYTFADLEQGLGAPGVFYVENATDALLGEHYFFAPNALGFGFYVPGGGAMFGRVGSFRIVPSRIFPTVTVHMIVSRQNAGNVIHVDGWRNGAVVSTSAVTIPAGTDVFTVELYAFDSPDEIRVWGTGSIEGGIFHALVDNVGPIAIDYFDAFCTGVGGTGCPCGNQVPISDPEGCAHSFGYGARLRVYGSASVSADSAVLLGSQMTNSSALYFQGTAMQNGGAGVPFGDGLRCAGGTIVRLGTKPNAGGASQYPESGDLPISVKGLVPPSGGLRTYQVWYRNVASFCTGATFNLSHGYAIFWGP